MNFDNGDEKILKYFDNLRSTCTANNTENHFNIDNIPLLHNSFLYIHDFEQAKIVDVRGMKEVLGWDFTELTTRKLYEIIHKDDRFLVYDITRYTIETILQNKIVTMPFDDILCLYYRMLTSDGHFKKILRQSTIIENNTLNIPTRSLSICTDIDYIDSPPNVKFHSVGKHTHIVNYEDYISKNKLKRTDVFTTREVEVLMLLGHGLTNKKISDILFISEHTVHKHISNMKEKSATKNSPELLKYAIFKGVIQSSVNSYN